MIESRSGNRILTFDEAEHIYTLDGEIVPGATDVKKGYPQSYQLIQYQVKQGIEEFKTGKKLKAQAAVGTLVHDYCWSLRMGKPFDYGRVNDFPDQEQVQKRMDEVLKWVEERVCSESVAMAEEIIASPLHKFAGKFDCLVLTAEGKLRLQDYKSAKGFYPDQFIQLGGYAQALYEWHGLSVDELEVIRFNDNTEKPASLVLTDVEEFEEQFLSCRYTRVFQNKWDRYFDKLYRDSKPKKAHKVLVKRRKG